MYFLVGSGPRFFCTTALGTWTRDWSRFFPLFWHPLMPQEGRSLKRDSWPSLKDHILTPQRPQPPSATLCFPCWQAPAPTSREVGKVQRSQMALGTE